MSFEIFTDSSASISLRMIEKYRLHIISLTFQEKGVPGEYKSFDNGRPVDTTVFYRRMRDENAVFVTSCVNTADALESIEPVLREGRDVLYLGFSSGLSATYQNVKAALDELRLKYPERTDYMKILPPEVFAVFSKLRARRKEIAQEAGVPAFSVFTDAQLAEIAKMDSPTPEKLGQVDGIGEARIKSFAGKLLEVLEPVAEDSGQKGK